MINTKQRKIWNWKIVNIIAIILIANFLFFLYVITIPRNPDYISKFSNMFKDEKIEIVNKIKNNYYIITKHNNNDESSYYEIDSKNNIINSNESIVSITDIQNKFKSDNGVKNISDRRIIFRDKPILTLYSSKEDLIYQEYDIINKEIIKTIRSKSDK